MFSPSLRPYSSVTWPKNRDWPKHDDEWSVVKRLWNSMRGLSGVPSRFWRSESLWPCLLTVLARHQRVHLAGFVAAGSFQQKHLERLQHCRQRRHCGLWCCPRCWTHGLLRRFRLLHEHVILPELERRRAAKPRQRPPTRLAVGVAELPLSASDDPSAVLRRTRVVRSLCRLGKIRDGLALVSARRDDPGGLRLRVAALGLTDFDLQAIQPQPTGQAGYHVDWVGAANKGGLPQFGPRSLLDLLVKADPFGPERLLADGRLHTANYGLHRVQPLGEWGSFLSDVHSNAAALRPLSYAVDSDAAPPPDDARYLWAVRAVHREIVTGLGLCDETQEGLRVPPNLFMNPELDPEVQLPCWCSDSGVPLVFVLPRRRRRLRLPDLSGLFDGPIDLPTSSAHALWQELWLPIVNRYGEYDRREAAAAVFSARWPLPNQPLPKRATWWCVHNIDFAQELRTLGWTEPQSTARPLPTQCRAGIFLQPLLAAAEDLRRYMASQGLELQDRDSRWVGLVA